MGSPSSLLSWRTSFNESASPSHGRGQSWSSSIPWQRAANGGTLSSAFHGDSGNLDLGWWRLRVASAGLACRVKGWPLGRLSLASLTLPNAARSSAQGRLRIPVSAAAGSVPDPRRKSVWCDLRQTHGEPHQVAVRLGAAPWLCGCCFPKTRTIPTHARCAGTVGRESARVQRREAQASPRVRHHHCAGTISSSMAPDDVASAGVCPPRALRLACISASAAACCSGLKRTNAAMTDAPVTAIPR